MNQTTAAPSVDVNLNDIDTRGFIVVRNFLSQQELDVIVKDYEDKKNNSDNGNYPISYPGYEVMELLEPKITWSTDILSKKTNTRTDIDQGGVYFSVSRGINFGWHQDHESFYTNQNHLDYLNFYIIIVKEKTEEANLNVIPFDKLKERSPEFYDKLVGGGARRFGFVNGETLIVSDETGAMVGSLPYDITELAETPHLHPGDLLLLRGDVIHSTQVSDSARVALSIRMVNSSNKISLKKLVSGGPAKVKTMIKNRGDYAKMIESFKRLRVMEATHPQLDEIEVDEVPSKIMFILKLYYLRLRLRFTDNLYSK